MRDFKPTASQKAAIEARGGAVLVSAGAGSGKTRVLTERLMGWLTDPNDPQDLDRFLIITFTKAAAGELRGRILEELAAAQAADPGNRRLRRQSALCRRAQIGTIHSFCAALLRQYSQQLGLTPDFAVADEERARAMKAAALERVLEERYAHPDRYPGFLRLADTVGVGRDDRRLAELILELHEKMQSHARPEKWAAEQAALLRGQCANAGDSPWGRELLDRAAQAADCWSRTLEGLLREMAAQAKIHRAYGPSIEATAEDLRALSRAAKKDWAAAQARLPISFPRLGVLRDSPDPVLSDKVKAVRDSCKKAMEKLNDSLGVPSDKLLADLAGTAPAMEALLELALDLDRAFSADKRRAGLVDFADLEHMAAQLLTEANGSPTALAGEISRHYTEIMVDEYQDVSRVQDAIFRAVSREGKNLFLVGDVKQSIYRFRLADPRIFTEKYLSYRDKPKPGEPRRILLRENFRSRPEVLNAANRVFSLCMSRSLGDIDYDDGARLLCGASFEGQVPKPELLLLDLPKGEEQPDKTALEAAMVAEKIRELVKSGAEVTDRGVRRPLRYGDIAILLRSANTVGGVYRRELARRGIPVGSGQSGGFFQAAEISSLLSILAVIDNPHQDIPLIAALRSPAFGFDADALSEIRASDRQGDFYTALLRRAETDGRSRDFLRALDELRDAAPDLSAAELLRRVLERFDLLALCGAMEDGPRRKARLLALAGLAERFEATGYRGLHRFLLWLRQLAEKGREPALGSGTEPAVQILSVHRSKGLEFPVVFLCDLGRRFNTSDSRAKVLVHPELGLGPKVTDLKARQEYPTLARNAIRQRLDRETLSEELRLLYVAMTRARERLIMTAALRDPGKALEKAASLTAEPMSPEILAGAGAPVNWLLYAAQADGGQTLTLRLCQAEEEAERREEKPAPTEAAPELLGELERRLRFRYAHSQAQALPSKLTATELKGRFEPDEEARPLAPAHKSPFRLPDFARQDRPLSGTELGTATHLLLQHIDLNKTETPEQIREELERLRAGRFLSDREAASVDAEAVCRLFRSPLGQRIRAAKNLQREFRFSLLWDAGDLVPGAEGEKQLMQGVVDCFFEEDGELVVVDYKTDFLLSAEQARERARSYYGQLRTYVRSLERICQKPVKECVLFFLSLGQAVPVPAGELREAF